MNRIKLWVALGVVALVTIVALQNIEPVTTHLLFVSVEMPRAALLGTTYGLGVLTGYLLRIKAAARPKS